MDALGGSSELSEPPKLPPRGPQEAPKGPPRGPREAPEGPKRSKKVPKRGPGEPQKAHKGIPRAFAGFSTNFCNISTAFATSQSQSQRISCEIGAELSFECGNSFSSTRTLEYIRYVLSGALS